MNLLTPQPRAFSYKGHERLKKAHMRFGFAQRSCSPLNQLVRKFSLRTHSSWENISVKARYPECKVAAGSRNTRERQMCVDDCCCIRTTPSWNISTWGENAARVHERLFWHFLSVSGLALFFQGEVWVSLRDSFNDHTKGLKFPQPEHMRRI